MADADRHGRRSILLVDADEPFRLVLALSLRNRGYDVRVAGDYNEAVTTVLANAPRYAVVELRLAGRSGLELIEAIRRIHRNTIVLVLTGQRGSNWAAQAIHRGAVGYLTKPRDVDEIINALNAAHHGGRPATT